MRFETVKTTFHNFLLEYKAQQPPTARRKQKEQNERSRSNNKIAHQSTGFDRRRIQRTRKRETGKSCTHIC